MVLFKVQELVKKNPVPIINATLIFLISFVLFFLVHDIFMVQIQTHLNFLYETIANATGITNIRPTLISLFSSTFWYTVLLFIIVLSTQSGIWYVLKTKYVLSKHASFIILGISAVFGVLLTLVLPGLPFIESLIAIFLVLFSIIYIKTLIFIHKKHFFSFIKQYTKIAGISVLLYIVLIFLQFLISFALLQSLQRNPYDDFGFGLYMIKWFFHIIVFQYIIYSSAYVAHSLGKKVCKTISIKQSFVHAFAKKSSYIDSAIFIVYCAILFSIGYGLLLLPNGNMLNFIFMTIFFLGGLIVFFMYEANKTSEIVK